MLLCLDASIIYLFFSPTALNYLSAHFQLKWEEIDDPKLSRVPDYEAGELEAVRGMGAQSRRRLESKDVKEAHSYTLHANSIFHFLVLIVKEVSVEVKEAEDQRQMINSLLWAKKTLMDYRYSVWSLSSEQQKDWYNGPGGSFGGRGLSEIRDTVTSSVAYVFSDFFKDAQVMLFQLVRLFPKLISESILAWLTDNHVN